MLRALTFAIAAVLIASLGLGSPAWAQKPKKKARAPSAKHPSTAKKRSTAAKPMPLYATRPDVMQAARALAERNAMEPATVQALIGQARYQAAVAQAVLPPASPLAKNWGAYRERFVEPRRIAAGVAYWTQHQQVLERIARETGVPAHLIAGILGVETFYGRHTGTFRVLDALCTLAFDFPDTHPKAAQRSAFFLGELEAYLRLTQRTGANALALRGSYAGALGLPQFMPSSWEKYGVDANQDGRVDLFFSPDDIVGSVAHYFLAFGWQKDQPTHFAAEVDADNPHLAALLAPDIVPSFTAAQLQALGVRLPEAALQYPGPLALVQLLNAEQPPTYVAGTQNFYTITRYNWSSYYALAVITLGEAVRDTMAVPTPMQK